MSEWKEALLRQHAKAVKGKISKQSDVPLDGYLPVINTEALVGNVTSYGEADGSILCSPRDVLMLWDGERSGLVGYGQKGVLGSTFVKFILSQEVDPEFLFYHLQRDFVWTQNQRTGTGVPHVPKDFTRIYKLSYPDLATQRTIARILGTVDGLIERTEALIAKQQQIKQGLLHDLFTRGVDAHGALRPPHSEAPELYHHTELGWLPKGWRVERLGNVSSVRGRVGWKGYTVHDLRDSGPLVLGAAQISKDNRLKLDEPVHLSMEKYLESPEIMVQEGDLLIVQRGSIGKVVMVDEPIGSATINPSMILLKVGGIDATFLYHWLCSPVLQDQIVNATSSTGVPMISQAQAGAFNIPIPHPDEQRSIAGRLAAIMDRIRIEEKEAAKFRLLKSGLMQDLLTGRVSVDRIMGRSEDRMMEMQVPRT